MKTGVPSNRLIIGDVGSGKTLVALISLIAYLESFKNESIHTNKNYEVDVALMAPTEVLATQHYQKLIELVGILDLDWLDCFIVTNKTRLLYNQSISKSKVENYLKNNKSYSENLNLTKAQEVKPRLAIWVGTQALLFLQDLNPALVVTDEQHRFGVRQRQNLSTNIQVTDINDSNLQNLDEKLVAHYVSMTATPIPRTLALTVYGDLKASYIKKINTRAPIITRLVLMEEFETVILPILKSKLKEEQKVYVIVPAIETKETGDPATEEIWTVAEAHKWLCSYLDPTTILTLHGKLSAKNEILEEFKNSSEKQVLISTTVIEVGVDVGEATLMLILNPERFGLSQLHQIRGRVGRNNYQDNYCFLVADKKEIAFLPRLKYLCTSQDGFEIAQEDLRLRGQGDIYGTEQSGNMEDLLGLDVKTYSQIRRVVDSLDMDNLSKNYDRLAKYLEEESKEVWGE